MECTEKPILIGLVGKKRVGKDTAAEYIHQNLGPGKVSRVAFADPLKAAVATLLGYPTVEELELMLGKENPIPWLGGVSLRRLYQTLGTEWGRRLIHPRLWLILMGRRLARLEEEGCQVIVITDVRFENEAEFIRDRGGVLIHIERQVPTPRLSLKDLMKRVLTHASERGVKRLPGEPVILNLSSLEIFKVKVLRVLHQVLCSA